MSDEKKFAIELVDKFYIGLEIKDYKKARSCAIFTAHQRYKKLWMLSVLNS